MAPPLLSLSGIHLTFGGTPLLEGASLDAAPQERICLVGRNGSGKSTLLKIAAGLVQPDKGERFAHPNALIRYLPQEPGAEGFDTVLHYVESGLGPADDPYRARYLVDELGLAPDADPAKLSGGEMKRAALARTLAPNPDVLLLDEPTNGLDEATAARIVALLASLDQAMIVVSHDRLVLERIATRAAVLREGKLWPATLHRHPHAHAHDHVHVHASGLDDAAEGPGHAHRHAG
jgi:ATP-binding cassette subfamily F protein uup